MSKSIEGGTIVFYEERWVSRPRAFEELGPLTQELLTYLTKIRGVNVILPASKLLIPRIYLDRKISLIVLVGERMTYSTGGRPIPSFSQMDAAERCWYKVSGLLYGYLLSRLDRIVPIEAIPLVEVVREVDVRTDEETNLSCERITATARKDKGVASTLTYLLQTSVSPSHPLNKGVANLKPHPRPGTLERIPASVKEVEF